MEQLDPAIARFATAVLVATLGLTTYFGILFARRFLMAAVYPGDFGPHSHPTLSRVSAGLTFALIAVGTLTWSCTIAWLVALYTYARIAARQPEASFWVIPLLPALVGLAVIALVIKPAVRYRHERPTPDVVETWEPWLGTDSRSTFCDLVWAASRYDLVQSMAATTLVLGAIASVDLLVPFTDDRLPVPDVLPLGLLAVAATLSSGAYRLAVPQDRLIHFALHALRSPGTAVLGRFSSSRFSASRWRSERHRIGFVVAQGLERTSYGLLRRLDARRRASARDVLTKLGFNLQAIGVTTTDADHEKFAELVHISVSIIASDRIGESLESAEVALSTYPAPPTGPPGPSGRVRGIADATNDAIQRYWPAIRVVAVLALLVALLTTGQLAQVVDLLAG